MSKNYLSWIALLCLFQALSCSSIKKSLSGKTSPHAAYGNALDAAGLRSTKLGSQWFAAAVAALQKPVTINVPYKETGFFAADRPGAAGFVFPLRKGELVKITVTSIPATGIKLFAELWQLQNANFKLLAAADTLTFTLQYECISNGSYILRLQPELLQPVEYTLTIVTSPSLAFPVHQQGNPAIISTWGVGRDNGARKHEGIDIAVPTGTPVLAVSNGVISRVTENNLGGKVIFLTPEDKDYSVYYAHLDKQLAATGQRISAGDVIGHVGNTGNAKNTVPHLHFGIYATGGAVDPQPFFENQRRQPPAITASQERISKLVRVKNNVSLYASPDSKASSLVKLVKDQAIFVQAASGSWYRVSLLTGETGYVNSSSIAAKPVSKFVLKDSTRLLNLPLVSSPAATVLPAGAVLLIVAKQGDFYFVESDAMNGWIKAGKN